MEEAHDVVPIGKYKGQPLEVLRHDPDYVEWLQSQSWFAEKHPKIHALIINNFQAPSETPEHNAIQARFLDDGFTAKVITMFFRAAIEHWEPANILPFYDNWLAEKKDRTTREELKKASLGDIFSYIEFAYTSEVKFECNGVDVCVDASVYREDPVKTDSSMSGYWLPRDPPEWRMPELHIAIEIKPAVSDDYPAVLRQIKGQAGGTVSKWSSTKHMLLIGEYTGRGATEEQFVEIFRKDNILVARLADIEKLDGVRWAELHAGSPWFILERE